MKKGQHKNQLAASYIDYFSYCTTACYIFNGNVEPNLKKGLVCVLNSSLTTYLLFLTSASWGIEREQVFMDEILESPALVPLLQTNPLNEIVGLFEDILSIKKSENHYNQTQLLDIENKINLIVINNILDFSPKEKITVNDSLNYSLDLFENQEKSIALYPVLQKQTTEYGKTISAELNEFLDSQDLFANATIYNISRFTPLMTIKLSFSKEQKEVVTSQEFVDHELKKIDQHLWEKNSSNIYFRKKLNYKTGDDIYIIRPNQRRFWSQSMALEDATELILEILNGN
ncbi:MAG: hypothetical protein IM589_09345 [Cytophagales bacterium]|nr:hypothetical protein [Cytophagales bacterium]